MFNIRLCWTLKQFLSSHRFNKIRLSTTTLGSAWGHIATTTAWWDPASFSLLFFWPTLSTEALWSLFIYSHTSTTKAISWLHIHYHEFFQVILRVWKVTDWLAAVSMLFKSRAEGRLGQTQGKLIWILKFDVDGKLKEYAKHMSIVFEKILLTSMETRSEVMKYHHGNSWEMGGVWGRWISKGGFSPFLGCLARKFR